MESACSVLGCYNTIDNPKVHCYSFPKDFDLCMLWVQTCGKPEYFEDFAYGGAQPFINKVVCSIHFEESNFNDITDLSKGLKPKAVPVLHVEKFQLVKQEFGELEDDNEKIKAENNDQVCHLVKQEFHDVDPQNEIDFSRRQTLDVDFGDVSLEESCLPILLLSKKKDNLGTPVSTESQTAFRTAWRRALENSELQDARNETNTLRNTDRRFAETEDEQKARNQANALRNSCRKANETEERRKDRLYKNAVRAALRRSMESEEEQTQRRRKNALRAAYRRSMETEEQKAKRRLKDKIRSAERRKKETELQSKLRKYNDAVRAAFRRSLETKEQRQQRRVYDVIRAAHRRSNETEEQRKKRLQGDRERAARKRLLKKIEQMSYLQNTFSSCELSQCSDYDIFENSSEINSNREEHLNDFQDQCTDSRLPHHTNNNLQKNINNNKYSRYIQANSGDFNEYSDLNNIDSDMSNSDSSSNEVESNFTSCEIVDNRSESENKHLTSAIIPPEVVWCT